MKYDLFAADVDHAARLFYGWFADSEILEPEMRIAG